MNTDDFETIIEQRYFQLLETADTQSASASELHRIRTREQGSFEDSDADALDIEDEFDDDDDFLFAIDDNEALRWPSR